MRLLVFLSFFLTNTAYAVELTSIQKQLILWGDTCCYSQEVINSVQQPVYVHKPVIELNLPPLKEPASNFQWTLFYTLQLLDVYTTERALQYNCVKELNPLLGDKPDLSALVGLKVGLLGPVIWGNSKYDVITTDQLAGANFLMTIVVANNYDIWNEAKTTTRCIKIR